MMHDSGQMWHIGDVVPCSLGYVIDNPGDDAYLLNMD